MREADQGPAWGIDTLVVELDVGVVAGTREAAAVELAGAERNHHGGDMNGKFRVKRKRKREIQTN